MIVHDQRVHPSCVRPIVLIPGAMRHRTHDPLSGSSGERSLPCSAPRWLFFLIDHSLRRSYEPPQLRLVLATPLYALGGAPAVP